LLIGAATYALAPRVGPNPFFGVRVGYSYASREVWDKTNRFGGMLMALTGLGVGALGLVLQWAGLATAAAFTLLVVVMVVALLAETGWMVLYARRLAQGATVPGIAPVPFRWSYLAPVVVTFALLLAVAAWFYPSLPAERVASHFNFAEQPDGWMARDAFYLSFLGLASLSLVIDALVVLVATREPLIAFGRWGAHWRLDPARGLIYVGLAFGLMNLILTAVLWDVAWFNVYGAHAFPLSWLVWLIVPLVAALGALFFVLGRRET
jgi:uncharacterized membrane protein